MSFFFFNFFFIYHTKCVQLSHQRTRIRKTVRIELPVPQLGPMEEIDHNYRKRNALIDVFMHNVENLTVVVVS